MPASSEYGSLEALGRASDLAAIVTGVSFLTSLEHTGGLPLSDPATGTPAAVYTSVMLEFDLVEVLQGVADQRIAVLVDGASPENKVFHSNPKEIYAAWFRRLDGFELTSRPDLKELLVKYPDAVVVTDSVSSLFSVRDDTIVPIGGAYRSLLMDEDVPVEVDGVMSAKPPISSFEIAEIRQAASSWSSPLDDRPAVGRDDDKVANLLDSRCREKESDSLKLREMLVAVAEGNDGGTASELNDLGATVFEPLPDSVFVEHDLSPDLRLRLTGADVLLGEALDAVVSVAEDLARSEAPDGLESVAAGVTGLTIQLSGIDAPACHELMKKLR